MTKFKFFSLAGVGATALYPFALLISNAKNEKIPALKEASLPTILEDTLLSSESSNSLLKTGSEEKTPEASHSQLSDSYPSTEKAHVAESKQTQVKKLTDQDIKQMKQDTKLDEWLDTIHPLIKKKQNLTIITRWNSHYFRLIQWDKDCQCFILLDSDYGIWSNNSGLFAIGKRWEKPKESSVSLETNSKCTNFNSFWYQDWNTWWRLRAWLKTFDNDKDGHRAVASCDKDPVVFLGTNTYFPIFLKTKGSGNITTDGPMNYYYDHQLKRFEAVRDKREMPRHFSKVSSYPDWQRLWNIGRGRRNWWLL